MLVCIAYLICASMLFSHMDSDFHKCELQNKHSKLGNKHKSSHDFCSGIIKLQNKKEQTLTNFERAALAPVLKSNHPAFGRNNAVSDTESSKVTTMNEDSDTEEEFNLGAVIDNDWDEKKKEQDSGESEYVDPIFVPSSAAIAESLEQK